MQRERRRERESGGVGVRTFADKVLSSEKAFETPRSKRKREIKERKRGKEWSRAASAAVARRTLHEAVYNKYPFKFPPQVNLLSTQRLL